MDELTSIPVDYPWLGQVVQKARHAVVLAEKATQGPWKWESTIDNIPSKTTMHHELRVTRSNEIAIIAFDDGWEGRPHDQRFIEAARSYLPELAEAVILLAQQVEYLERMVHLRDQTIYFMEEGTDQ